MMLLFRYNFIHNIDKSLIFSTHYFDRLAAKYGDLSLKQREGTFTKKNVGRRVEGELNQYLKKSEESQRLVGQCL